MTGFETPIKLGDLIGCGLIRGALAMSGKPFKVCEADRPGVAIVWASHEMPTDFDQESMAELLARAGGAIIDGRDEARDNLPHLFALRAANDFRPVYRLIVVVECIAANELAWHHFISPRVRILHTFTDKPKGRPDA